MSEFSSVKNPAFVPLEPGTDDPSVEEQLEFFQRKASELEQKLATATKLLKHMAPRFDTNYVSGSNLIVLGPLPSGLSDAPKPPRLELYQRELELGEVVHFKQERGFGHIDTENGHIFFHISGYRVPSVHEYELNGQRRHILQLEKLPKTVPTDTTRFPSHILTNPTVSAGDSLLFLSGIKSMPDGSNKRQAQIWTLQEPYQEFVAQQQALHAEELNNWARLAKYRLQLIVDVWDGHYIEDGIEKPRGSQYNSTLFEGTETSMLRDWYQHFKDMLGLNELRRVVLSCSEYDEAKGNHGPFVACEQEVMEDFLG